MIRLNNIYCLAHVDAFGINFITIRSEISRETSIGVNRAKVSRGCVKKT